MAQITIHRALAELKLADSKISKKTRNVLVVGYKKAEGLVNGKTELAKFNTDSQGQYDSMRALINRKNALKAAIVASNAITVVKIGDTEMTVAEAITRKSFINLETNYVEALKKNLAAVQRTIENNNATVDANALELVKTTLGRDADVNSAEALAVSKSYTDLNKLTLVDPISIEETIKTLEEDIENFNAEVDAILSESNATTTIEVED